MKYQWLLFDADNTLFDFHQASKLSFQQLMTEFEIEWNEDLYSNYKKRNHEVWSDFEEGKIDTYQLKSKRFQLFFQDQNLDFDPNLANDTYLRLLVKNAVLLDGAKGLIHELHTQRYPMAIITNGLKEVQRLRLKNAGLYGYFNHIIVSDEIGVAKPDHEYFDYINDLMRRPSKDKVLVIGDNLHSDIIGGINYGYDTCWFNIDNQEKPSQINPKHTITNLDQLGGLIY